MRYASVCSGVEAASLAWEPLGWKPVWFSEIEPFPCAVLQKRFGASRPVNMPEPEEAGISLQERKTREIWIRKNSKLNPEGRIQNLGDMTRIEGEKYRGAIDLLVGGTPCQSFSVAGRRKGLDDARGQLMLKFVELAFTSGAKWVVWENVPGVLSQDGGKAFQCFLSCLSGWDVDIPEDGWRNFGVITNAPGFFGLAWRILDAQYVRVDGFPYAIPQRRRRIFLVGYLGNWRRAAQVLFEPESLLGNSPPRRSQGTGVARSLTASTGGTSGKEQQHTYIGRNRTPLNALGIDGYNGAITGDVSGTVDVNCKNVNGPTLVCLAHGQANAKISKDVASTLSCNHEAPICFKWAASPSQNMSVSSESSATITSSQNGMPAVLCFENHAQDSRVKEIEVAPVLSAKAGTGGNNLPLVAAFMAGQGADAGGIGYSEVISPTLRSEAGGNSIPSISIDHARIRRLVPVECERLMGFPDNWTLLSSEAECPDGPRYKACGNSICVNAIRWIGRRIEKAEQEAVK